MKKSLVYLTALSSLFASTQLMAAGTLAGNFNVHLVISSGCLIAGGTQSGATNNFGVVEFGTKTGLTSVTNGQLTGLTINCTTSLPYTVALNNGANGTGAQRRMIGSGSGSNFVSYNLYQDAGFATSWTSTVNLAGTGTGTAQPLIVYAQVPIQATPIAGSYSDTVTMTVAW